MRKKKWVACALATAFGIALMLSGCSGKQNAAGDSGAGNSPAPAATDDASAPAGDRFELGSEPLSFSFYGNYDWMTTQPWGADPATKWIQDNMKVNVTPIQSGGAAKQKLATMIASNSLPDVMMLDRGADVDKLYQAGKLVPLDPYLDKYPNLKKYAGTATLNLLRSADGKLYQFPNWYTSKPTGNAAYAVNSKIYESLGSPKLETFDDLYAYLKMVKEQVPNVIPFEVDSKAQGVEMMLSGFGEDPNNIYMRATPGGDRMTSLFEDPVYKEAMTFANKLFREKLITQDAFTQTRDQVKEKMSNGNVAVALLGVSLDDYKEYRVKLKQKDPDADYKLIWPLHKDGVDPNSVFPSGYNQLGWNVLVITSGTKNPEGVFAYLDWLTGPEGQATTWFGPAGLYWDQLDDQGYPVMNDKWTTTSDDVKTQQQLGQFNWVGNTGYIDPVKSKINESLPEDKRDWVISMQNDIVWKTSKDMTEFTNLDPDPNSPEGIAKQAINDLYDQYFAKMMFAGDADEVAKLLEEEDASAKKLGYDKLLSYMTEKWQENLKNMKQ